MADLLKLLYAKHGQRYRHYGGKEVTFICCCDPFGSDADEPDWKELSYREVVIPGHGKKPPLKQVVRAADDIGPLDEFVIYLENNENCFCYWARSQENFCGDVTKERFQIIQSKEEEPYSLGTYVTLANEDLKQHLTRRRNISS